MAAGVTHNAGQVGRELIARGRRLQPGMYGEVTKQAQLVARAMRARVAKHRSLLVNSIQVEDTGFLEKKVAPGAAHGYYVEKGVKPGGKGLPRFFDPASADILAWLEDHPYLGNGPVQPRGKKRKPRRGSPAMQKVELVLRQRHFLLSRHIRKHGVQAQPFVEPTAREMAGPVARALRQAAIDIATGKRTS
jgi:hypothetical protein